MLVPNQKITVKWNGRNKEHFVSFGYEYTKLGDEIEVNVEHLTKGNDSLVKAICDFCNREKDLIFNQYYKQVIKNNLDSYCCKECISKRIEHNYEKNLKGLRIHKKCDTKDYEGIVYNITEKVESLNDIQKILINEVKRFCEENKRFPNEKEMSNKNGYVSRTQFYKFFETKTFTDIYEFIFPLQKETRNKEITTIQKKKNKPDYYNCSRCKINKEFNVEYFAENKANKYGLKTICRECENKQKIIWNYKKKGIIFEEFTDISPEQWWEYLYEGRIKYLPDFCLEEQNIIKIIRYVFLQKLNLPKKEICEFNTHELKKYKLFYLYTRYYNKLKFLNICFPEMNIKSYDLLKSSYKEHEMIEFIEHWIAENNFSIYDLLNSKYNTKTDKKMVSFVAQKFDSYVAMLTWYFDQKEILHPSHKRKIKQFDFASKPNNFWNNENNRIEAIKTYCIDNGIEKVIHDTALLKNWIFVYFRQHHICKILNYSDYYNSLYDILTICFPKIKNEKILFKWEWHQWNTYDDDLLIQMMQELVKYRLKLDDYMDIPKHVNYSRMEESGYSKFNKLIVNGKVDNYYDWCCTAFPEYKEFWTYKDFKMFIADDGSICDSFEELTVYEFIKNDLKIKEVKAIGTRYKSKHSFVLEEKGLDKWYAPDFVVEDLLDKPIYIEYFGLYVENPLTNLLINYKEKTERKIKYYDSIDYCYFIYLYPIDLKDNFKGIKDKLERLLKAK
ncbi:hypothetical protein [Metabacillus fastidiosus]|uniref:hypothetical protein n=1 Tax=Metabacillus fastidiosus TaxID=1458 RepID=UPI003D27AB29